MTTKSRAIEADPETRRKAIKAALDSEAGGDFTKKKRPDAPKPKAKRTESPSLRERVTPDILNPKKARERTVEGKNESLSEAVDKAVRGAKREY
jgi:hypothetical protein